MIRPTCAKCNAQFETIYLGGEPRDREKECAVPVICYNCGTIKTDNIHKPSGLCETCGEKLTYAGQVTQKEVRASVFTWRLSIDYENPRFYVLKSNFYRCPKCNTRNLSFETAGCWD